MGKIRLYALAALAVLAAAVPVRAQKIDRPVNLTDETFITRVFDYRDEVENMQYRGALPAVVDFHAVWCGPCRMVSPVMKELAERYAGRIIVYKVNIDRAPEVARALGVESVPMVLFVPLKGEPTYAVGARSAEFYDTAVRQILLEESR